MSKYHIGKNGPAICKAEKRACRFATDQHYNTIEEANTAYEIKMKKMVKITFLNN